MKLLRSEYKVVDGKPIVYLFTRGNDGKRDIKIDKTFEPYFYISADENITDERILRIENKIYEDMFGKKLKKVIAKLPRDVPKLRNHVSYSAEADINYTTRYLIDEVDSIESTTPKNLVIDIEVLADKKVPNPVLAQKPIICIGTYDDLGQIYNSFVFKEDISHGTQDSLFEDCLHEIRYFRSETDMLESFTEFFRNEGVDIVTGWNSNRFDMPYLVNRMRNLNIDINKLSPIDSTYTRDNGEVIIKGIALIDLYDAYRHFTFSQEESYKLDFIARKVLGRGKTESPNNVGRMWKLDLDKLIDYNACDVFLVKEISEKLKLLDFMDELRRLTFCQLEDTLVASRLIDSYILRYYHNRKVFPTKTHHEKYNYQGAFVETWAKGIYENVFVFDLRSLYPNLLVNFNLSPETMLDEPKDGSIKVGKYNVDITKKGFLVEVIENLFKERTKYKELAKAEVIGSEKWKIYDTRQYTLKTLLNAIYGQTAYPNSRIFSPKVAETITYLGRETIKWSKEYLEQLGHEVKYVDTDSLFWIANKQLSTEEIEQVRDSLNESYNDFVAQFGISKSILEMEFEKIYRRAFFSQGTKKRYSGHLIYKSGQETDSLEIVGMEVRRSDSSQFSRNLQHNVLDMILREDKPKDEVLGYIGNEIDRIRKGDFKFTEIGIPKGINRELSEYGRDTPKGKIAIPANIRGAIYSQEHLRIQLSSKPKMVYVSRMPKEFPGTDVICFDEDNQIPPGMQIDIEKMLDRLVKSKLESIFEALGWKMSELVYYWRGRISPEGEQLNLWKDSK